MPGAGAVLPTQSTINTILLNTSYMAFTPSLEVQAHNNVHNWCNGTITVPATAAKDPFSGYCMPT
jgi:tyrosinase